MQDATYRTARANFDVRGRQGRRALYSAAGGFVLAETNEGEYRASPPILSESSQPRDLRSAALPAETKSSQSRRKS
jgi:hypothetical protein